jgi:hypothetical protein
MYHKLQLQISCNTIYPRDIVCFRYTTVNTLLKDDDDDDDDGDDDNNNNNNNIFVRTKQVQVI